MQSTLPHITEPQHQLLRETISRIVEAVKPEKILCFGVRTSKLETWSCFLPATDPLISADYDLLVIPRERTKAKREAVAQVIQNYNNASIKFTTLVHSIDAVNDGLQQGNFFFTSLYHQGVILYDGNNLPLTFPPEKNIHVIPSPIIESDWKKWSGLARKFYDGAVYALSKEANDLAVFMLHQGVEHICIALIRIYMGYRRTTHKLSKLLAMVENFSRYSVTVFPRLTADEIRLFAVLESAYVKARYKADYAVDTSTVNILKEQVEELLKIAECLYIEKLNAPEIRKTASFITRDLLPFESIGLDTFADVILQKGEREGISIESKEDIAHAIITTVEDNRLWVSTAKDGFDVLPEAKVNITYVRLNGFVVNHSGKVTCKECIEVPRLGIVQNGRGNIDLEVEVLELDATINKTGDVIIAGSADEVRVLNHGSGDFDGSKLETTSANITVRGAGNVSIHVEDDLMAELQSEGNLFYHGIPKLKFMKVEGVGRVIRV